MILESKYKPELVASDDPYRETLHHVHFDVKEMRLYATNGAAMAIVPVVEACPQDATGAISTDALAMARKYKSKGTKGGAGSVLGVIANGSLKTINFKGGEGCTFPRPTVNNVPAYDAVTPKHKIGDKGVIAIHFDAALLARLADAIGATDGVTITIDTTDERAGMLVRANTKKYSEAIGVIMPQLDAKRDGANAIKDRAARSRSFAKFEIWEGTPHKPVQPVCGSAVRGVL